MKVFLQLTHIRPAEAPDRWIEQSLSTLLPFVRIDEAHVRLVHDPEASPAFQASAHLVVPGPDLRAEAVDHTARTAFAKVLAQLQVSAHDRADRRHHRRRIDRHLPMHALAGIVRR